MLIILAAAAWVAALLAAPWAASSGDGARPAVRAAALLYVAAGTICHQQPARSFHVAGIRLPVCARCLGLYLGALAGLLAACRLPRGDPRRLVDGLAPQSWWLIVGGAALPGALFWVAEMGGWLPPGLGNPVRLSAGILLGAVGGWVVGLAVAAWPVAR